METATPAPVKSNTEMAAQSSKDPLASCNIPQVIEDRQIGSDGRTIAYKYARGKVLGKVSCFVRF